MRVLDCDDFRQRPRCRRQSLIYWSSSGRRCQLLSSPSLRHSSICVRWQAMVHSFSKLKYFSLTHALPLDFLLCEGAQLKLKTSSVLWKSDWKQLWAVMDCKQWSLDFWQKAAVLKLQSYLNILQKHSLYFFPLCSWLNWLRFKGLID